MDNESFRYLVLRYNGVMELDPRQRSEYAKSWEKSATSSAVFLTYVLNALEPKAIQNIILAGDETSLSDMDLRKQKNFNPILEYGKLLCSCLCFK